MLCKDRVRPGETLRHVAVAPPAHIVCLGMTTLLCPCSQIVWSPNAADASSRTLWNLHTMARISNSSSASTGNGHITSTGVDTQSNAEERSKLRAWMLDEPSFDSQAYTNTEAVVASRVVQDPSLLPNGARSLSLIALQAFAMGLTFALGFTAAILLAREESTLWRLPAFLAALSVFHFLEFWTTAHFNTPAARASSYLLYSNGTAYNVAHALATIEIITSYFIPHYQSLLVNGLTISVGIILILVGQTVRSMAMAQAGTNFSHLPAKTKKDGHVLVDTGIYSLLRHPAYFGFFWWALGTQILVGNKVCLLGYFAALWRFFQQRIKGEQSCLDLQRLYG
jgi:protein-S-isoprenylcysteine O-methyltransferase